MKTQTITIIILLIAMGSIAIVSAANYPGERIIVSNDMGIENLVYTIIENSSTISGILVEVNLTNITITFPQDMVPNSFKIIFLEEQTKTVVQEVHVGGGGGRSSTRTVYRDNIINEIVEKEVEVKVDGETITKTEEVEKIIERIPTWAKIVLWILTILLLLLLLFMLFEKYTWEKERIE